MVEIVTDPPWAPEMMSDDARRLLGWEVRGCGSAGLTGAGSALCPVLEHEAHGQRVRDVTHQHIAPVFRAHGRRHCSAMAGASSARTRSYSWPPIRTLTKGALAFRRMRSAARDPSRTYT